MKHGAFFLFLVLQWRAFAQSPTFNLVQDYGFPVNQFFDVTVNDDTIVGLGIAYPDSFNLTQGVFLAKIDSNGNLIKTNLIFDSAGDHLTIDSPGSRLMRTKDRGYIFITSPFARDNAVFIKVNSDLEEEFRYEFIDTINLTSFAFRVIETKSGYLMYGFVVKQDFQFVAVIRHIDKSAHVLWEKQFPYNNNNSYVMDIKPINDSTFVACSNIDIDFSIFKGYSSILTFDIHGNQLSYWESEVDSEEGHLTSITPTPDNGFIANAIRLYDRVSINEKVQTSFVKFDANYNVEWIKHWGRITNAVSSLRMYDVYKMKDGNYLHVGKTAQDTDGDGFFYPVGWMVKHSPSGDSIWSRNITLPAPDQVNLNGMFGGGILSSGSIIGGGYARINEAYYGWLVKLTNDGCLDTLFACQPTPVREEYQPETTAGLSIAPNPAQSFTQVYLPDNERYNYQLQITGSDGRVLEQCIVPAGFNPVMVNLEKYATGVYFATVRRREDGKFFINKIVVLRP